MSAPENGTPQWKPKDFQFLVHALTSVKEKPNLDFKVIGPLLGYSNHRSACNYWYDLQKRLASIDINDPINFSSFGAAAGPSPGAAAKPARSPKKKAVPTTPPASSDTETGGSDGSVQPAPDAPTETAAAAAVGSMSPRKRKVTPSSATLDGEMAKAARRSQKGADGAPSSPRKKASKKKAEKAEGVGAGAAATGKAAAAGESALAAAQVDSTEPSLATGSGPDAGANSIEKPEEEE